ncbi:MAG: hypothetical protein IH604_10375 [Burkholderiales bacterium]|nr:hypothetical protein [Burkholderiales bacterium]
MTSCCSSSDRASKGPGKHHCPANDLEYSEVSVRTIVHHLAKPWGWTPSAGHYYFCGDPECEIAYFGDDNTVVLKSQLRTRVGVKESGEDALLCYCFGVSRADYALKPVIKDFVTKQTKAGLCSCETSNPSGRCCLRDFPKAHI